MHVQIIEHKHPAGLRIGLHEVKDVPRTTCQFSPANDTQEPRITIEPQLVHQAVTIGQHTITVAYKASSRQVISTLTGWGGL